MPQIFTKITYLILALSISALAFGLEPEKGMTAAPGVQTMRDACGHVAASSPIGFDKPASINTTAPSQAADWQTLGPFGGDVADVAASPAQTNIVLAGLAPTSGSGLLFRSTDSGASWTQISALDGYHIYDIEFAPDGTAYLGTADSIWKSTDHGVSWSQLNLNIGLNDVVLEVTLDPSDSNRIWVGVDDAMGGQPSNVMLSTNAGSSWADKTPNMSAMGCTCIAVDPTDSNKIIAGFSGAFGGGAVYVSSDGGTSWANRTGLLPQNPMNDAAHDGTRMYIAGGMQFGSQGVGLYTSTNDGVTWVNLSNTFPSLYIQDIEIDPNDNNTILAGSIDQGLFMSTDAGANWTFGAGGSSGLALKEASYEPGSSTDIYLGATSNAVWKSTDSAASFAPSSVGIGQLNVMAIASNPLNSREMAIAFEGQNNGGLYSTLDGGQTWTLENVPGTRYGEVAFAQDGTLYAISTGPSSVAPEGLYRRDGGSWTCLGPDQGTYYESDLIALAFSLTDPDLIVATGADFGVAGFEGTIWLTDDAGDNWTKVYEGPEDNEVVRGIAIVQDGTDQIMIAPFSDFGSNSTGGVMRSTDGGSSWSDASGGIVSNARCSWISHTPDMNTFYVSCDYYGSSEPGLYKSVDAGASWRSTNYIGNVRKVAASTYIEGLVYIAQNDTERVWKSTDGGETFTAFNTGLDFAGYPNHMRFKDTTGCELLMASTTGSYATIADFPLVADADTVTESAGGTVDFTLDAGSANAGRTYFLLGCVTGVHPGTSLPGGYATLPLNWDIFTDVVLSLINTPVFSNFFNTLDGSGQSTAQLFTGPLPTGFAGTKMYYAYALKSLYDYTSNPVMVEIIP